MPNFRNKVGTLASGVWSVIFAVYMLLLFYVDVAVVLRCVWGPVWGHVLAITMIVIVSKISKSFELMYIKSCTINYTTKNTRQISGVEKV